MTNAPKTVLAIHDLPGFGRAALSVIVPVLSTLGVQTVALPTAVLSTHTGGLGTPAKLANPGYGPAALEHYHRLGVKFDCIYSGYLADAAQAKLVEQAFELWPRAFKVVDPVLGDGGRLYSGLGADMVPAMYSLCSKADLIVPNVTEAALLLGDPLPGVGSAEQAAAQAGEDVVAQREEALAKQLEEQRRKKAKLVDPLQYEMSIQAEDLAGYVPAFGWEAGPPSEQQTAALEKLGILPDAVESAGKAALLLDRLNKRRDEGLTTPKQIRCLEKYGFQHVGTWSFEAARHMIDRIAAQGWRGVPKGVNPRTYTPAAEPPAADSPFDFGW